MGFAKQLSEELANFDEEILNELRGNTHPKIGQMMDWATSGSTEAFSDAVDLAMEISTKNISREQMTNLLHKVVEVYKAKGPEAAAALESKLASMLGIEVNI